MALLVVRVEVGVAAEGAQKAAQHMETDRKIYEAQCITLKIHVVCLIIFFIFRDPHLFHEK